MTQNKMLGKCEMKLTPQYGHDSIKHSLLQLLLHRELIMPTLSAARCSESIKQQHSNHATPHL